MDINTKDGHVNLLFVILQFFFYVIIFIIIIIGVYIFISTLNWLFGSWW